MPFEWTRRREYSYAAAALWRASVARNMQVHCLNEIAENLSMHIILKPMGIVVLMASFTALASLAIYVTGPKPSAGSSDDFGRPVPPPPVYTPNPSASRSAPPAAVAAGPSGNVPPVTAPLLTPDLDLYMVLTDVPTQVKHAIVADPNTPNAPKQYLHAVITRIDPKKAWSIQIERTVDVDVPAGQNLVLRVIARSPTSNPIGINFLRNGADHHDDFTQGVTLTSAWKTYTFPFTTSRTYLYKSADEGAAVCIHIGQQTGTVDLAALQVYPADQAPSPGTP
jgi:hypothetical protein